MRIYLPATVRDLQATSIHPALVHAVTDALRAELAEDDQEMLELVAFLAAADDSVDLIRERGDVPRRVVISADVPESALEPAPGDAIETALTLIEPVTWDLVAAVHSDDDDAETAAEVGAAAEGDEEAFERLGDRELLWYDVSELEALRVQFGE